MNKERTRLRRLQAIAVMPLIGPMLDEWEGLPNDVRSDPELSRLALHINHINDAMEEGK